VNGGVGKISVTAETLVLGEADAAKEVCGNVRVEMAAEAVVDTSFERKDRRFLHDCKKLFSSISDDTSASSQFEILLKMFFVDNG